MKWHDQGNYSIRQHIYPYTGELIKNIKFFLFWKGQQAIMAII